MPKIVCVGDSIESMPTARHHASLHLDPEEIRSNNSMFRLLNDRDRDILYLIFVSGKSQTSVSRILKCTQPLLHYNIKRIKHRVRFIAYLRRVFDVFADFAEGKLVEYDQHAREVVTMMFYTTSYTVTGKILDYPQIYVRKVFERALERMLTLRHWDAYEIFSVIKRHKNMIRRVGKGSRIHGGRGRKRAAA